MRKAAKRTEEEPVENASAKTASPPKKAKARKPAAAKESELPVEPRLPRNAKTNAKAAMAVTTNYNNNNVVTAIETNKKPRANGRNALQKSNSSDNVLAVEVPGKIKKSRSAEDVTPKKRGTKSNKVAAKKSAPKKAGTESKAKPKEKVEAEPKNSTARRRGKAVQMEPQDVEEAKTSKGKKNKAASLQTLVAPEAPKRTRGKKSAPVAQEDDKEAEVEEEENAETIAKQKKPARAKKPTARGKKSAPLSEEPEIEAKAEAEPEENYALDEPDSSDAEPEENGAVPEKDTDDNSETESQ